MADMVIKGYGVEDTNAASGRGSVVEVLSGTGTVVGAARVGGGTIDVTSCIGGVGACGRDYMECSSCGTFSACGGFATGAA